MANYFLETQSHEWILTAQNGAYALGTGNLINQRKYNGLLVRSDEAFERKLLVSSIEEEIEWRGESMYLDSSHYHNCIYPEGFLHLVKSWLRPYPAFIFSSIPHNEDILIKKEIMMDETTSTVLLKYTNLSMHTLHFRLRPKLALRVHHHLNEAGTFDRVNVSTEYESLRDLADIVFRASRDDNGETVFGWLQHGFGFLDKRIYRNVYFPWEAARGYPSTEDLVSPLGFEFELKVNETNYLLFSDTEIADAHNMVERIEKRYKKLPAPADIPQKRKKTLPNTSLKGGQDEEGLISKLDFDDGVMFEYDDYLKILEFSMRDFLANGDVVAGFPWFGCWGRDTMIAMDGVLKLPKGAAYCYETLQRYAKLIKDGLIPNMCSESSQQMNYISIDATLWFILRLYQVCKALSDSSKSKKPMISRWKDSIKLVENIFENILETPQTSDGRPKDFFLRTDGLLELRENFASATWMDAKVYDRAVTPRDGAPVEINALLYNAICAYEKMIDEYNEITPGKDNLMTNQAYLEARSVIGESFEKFWIGDFLADRLIGDTPVREYRPNAVIAMSLPFSNRLLSTERLQQVYETAHVELWTPYGLRSLSPKDPRFQKKYVGGCIERDKAYHQGTVWGWLLLPMVKTWLNAFPQKSAEEHINHISYLIDALRNGYMRGHIASVAEVWDGDKPHFPKGCPAQAWSVAALWTIENIILEFK